MRNFLQCSVNVLYIMKLLFLLVLGFHILKFTDSAPKHQEELGLIDDQAVAGIRDSRTPKNGRSTDDAYSDTSNNKRARRPSFCRPIPTRRLRAILARRVRILRNLGVRVIVTSRSLRKALRKTGKVVKPVYQRAGNDSALCPEERQLVQMPANTEATVAYIYYSVSCPREHCSVRISTPEDSNWPLCAEDYKRDCAIL